MAALLHRLPLRWTIPVALMLFVALAVGLTLTFSKRHSGQVAQRNALSDLVRKTTRLKVAIERAIRHEETGVIQAELSALGTDPEIVKAALGDGDMRVLASLRLAEVGKPFNEVFAGIEGSVVEPTAFEVIRRSLIGEVQPLVEGQSAVARYPVELARVEGSLRPNVVGVLVVVQDFSSTKELAYAELERLAWILFLLMSLFALGLGLFFHFRVARRLQRIATVAGRVGEGDLGARTALTGGDEVAQTAVAFDRMIEERQKAMAELRLTNRAIEADQSGIIITDATSPDNPIIYANPAFEEITGYSSEEVLGKNCRFLQADETNQAQLGTLRDALAKGEGCRVLLRNYRIDGTPFWNELTISPVHDEDGVLTNFVGVQNDATERRRAIERFHSATEEEQERVARDLHDGLCQELFGIQCVAKGLEVSLQKRDGPEAAAMAQVVKSVASANQTARRMAHGLASVVLRSEGLVSALEQLLESARSTQRVACELEVSPPDLDVPPDAGAQLYRIAQEALRNALKHAQASNIVIAMQQDGRRLLFEIRDDGVGGVADEAGSGMGVASMRHRASLLGGTCRIREAYGGGTVVSCLVWLEELDEVDQAPTPGDSTT